MNKSQIILEALNYLMDYRSALDNYELGIDPLACDFYYRDRLERTIYFLTQIYYQLKGE